MDEVNAQRDKEPKKGGKFEKLEEDVSELGRNLAKVRTQVELKVSTIKDEGGNIAAPEKELGELRASSESKRRQVEELTASYTAVKDKQNTLQTALTSAEELLQTVLTGLSSNKTGQPGGGYMDRIADAKSGAGPEQFKVQIQTKEQEKELKELEARWKAVEPKASDGARVLEAMSVAVEGFKKRLCETGGLRERPPQRKTGVRVRRLSEVQVDVVQPSERTDEGHGHKRHDNEWDNLFAKEDIASSRRW